MEHTPLAFRSIRAGGTSTLLAGLQGFASSCNFSRTVVISGRADGEDSYISTQDFLYDRSVRVNMLEGSTACHHLGEGEIL